jgi:hypothetical protein
MVCDKKVCFHRTNSRVGWQLVIHGVIDFHYDDTVTTVFYDEARPIYP